MNDRIMELARQCGWKFGHPDDMYSVVDPQFAEKFAELIIRECLQKLVDEQLGAPTPIAAGLNFGKVVIKEHFGVE